jgi:hypothetical protein
MSYSDLRDFEPEYVTTIDTATVEIEKLGGGTVGGKYVGTWRYRHTDANGRVELGQDLETPMPHTHREAARIVADYFSEEL